MEAVPGSLEVIRALRPLEAGSVVEVMTTADQGLVNDLGISCHTTGHELLSAQAGASEACLLIRKAEPKRNGRVMTVIRHQVSQQRVFGARRVLPLRRSFTVSNQP